MIKVALSIYWYVFHTFVSKQINIDFIFICMGKTNKSQYSDNLHLYSCTLFFPSTIQHYCESKETHITLTVF